MGEGRGVGHGEGARREKNLLTWKNNDVSTEVFKVR